jgi:hypothetical protein
VPGSVVRSLFACSARQTSGLLEPWREGSREIGVRGIAPKGVNRATVLSRRGRPDCGMPPTPVGSEACRLPPRPRSQDHFGPKIARQPATRVAIAPVVEFPDVIPGGPAILPCVNGPRLGVASPTVQLTSRDPLGVNRRALFDRLRMWSA